MHSLVGTWSVTAVSGADIPQDAAHQPWLTFDGDGQVYGMSGVNRVRGTFVVEGETVTFGPMASTMMAGPDDAMRVEAAVLATLAGPLDVDPADRDAPGRLGLVGPTGSVTLTRALAEF
ncbi:META domain-containing protein [Cellulomonas sp. JH27-2]|uniref:META domain-containing protein n=1 Tax=Cellulomonas sp. JH27-2 TaxID=2774139 RepID=UPI0017802F75|nr:META domain-containing protein [Cellulomonas sp. JH27-2]MBD8060398.1 META domain-containing protein [Cellulomonas sp. JH27-2]